MLAVLWWAWAGYAWLTSVVDPEEGSVRIAMFVAMASLAIVALCVPEAFGDRALAFAARLRRGAGRATSRCSRSPAATIPPYDARCRRSRSAPTIAVSLLVVASFFDGARQAALWGLAIVFDWVGPALFRRRGWMDGWKLVPAHFAERHNLVIIIALGESIVALGVAAEVELTAGVYVAAVLGIALASAVWWIYFDVVALVTERRLALATAGRQRNVLARDSYSYLHYPMVAGIVLAAFGLEETLAHVGDPLEAVPAFALLGGIAIYLLAHVALAAAQRAHAQPPTPRPRARPPRLVAAGQGDHGSRHPRRGQRPHLGDDRLRDGHLRRAALPPSPRPRRRSAGPLTPQTRNAVGS